MVPRVILHNGVSVDGRMDWFAGNVDLYYELAAHWAVDAVLSGSRTIVTAFQTETGLLGEDEGSTAPPERQQSPGEEGPLLVVVDSRGRVRCWNWLQQQAYWRDVVALCSRSTPQDHLATLERRHVDTIVAGDNRVDLRAALEALNAQHGVETVRVDSGGVLNGALLRAGLVDEVSVLINPTLVGGTTPHSLFVAPDLAAADGVIRLGLAHVERVRGDAVWLRYTVLKESVPQGA